MLLKTSIFYYVSLVQVESEAVQRVISMGSALKVPVFMQITGSSSADLIQRARHAGTIVHVVLYTNYLPYQVG